MRIMGVHLDEAVVSAAPVRKLIGIFFEIFSAESSPIKFKFLSFFLALSSTNQLGGVFYSIIEYCRFLATWHAAGWFYLQWKDLRKFLGGCISGNTCYSLLFSAVSTIVNAYKQPWWYNASADWVSAHQLTNCKLKNVSVFFRYIVGAKRYIKLSLSYFWGFPSISLFYRSISSFSVAEIVHKA